MSTAGFGTQPNTTGLGEVAPSVSTQDLTRDPLVTNAQRCDFGGIARPMLGGIPLLAKLGQGGMGAVYYGIHPRLQTEVAVKVLPFHLAEQQPELIQRFFREAQIAARVKSPHLVSVTDVNQESGLFYLVMEFISGKSAGSYLKAVKQSGENWLKEDEALDICVAATEGLDAAHQEGIIHRDIKPDNIMIPKLKGSDLLNFKAAKLADLGLARGEELGQSLTGAGACMGTPGYMAPEQALDAKAVRKPGDVFSMGATLYALLSGNAPFGGSVLFKMLQSTMNDPHPPLRQIRADLSDATITLIDLCLQKDPARRYKDAHALLEAMRLCRASLGESRVAPQDVERLQALTLMPETGETFKSSTPGLAATQVSAPLTQQVPAPPGAATAANAAAPAQPAKAGLNTTVIAAIAVCVVALVVGAVLLKGGDKNTGSGGAIADVSAKKAPANSQQSPAETGKNDSPAKIDVPKVDPQKAEQDRLAEEKRKAEEAQREKEAAQRKREDEAKQQLADARRALDAAVMVATDAKQKSDWNQVIQILEKPLAALGENDHLTKPAAQALIQEAKDTLKKQADYATQIEKANAILKTGLFEQARTAFEAARQVWPDAPQAQQEKLAAGLKACDDGVHEKRYQVELAAGKTALAGEKWSDAETRFQNALKEKPDDETARKGVADAQAGADRKRQAEAAQRAAQQYATEIADGRDKMTAKNYDAAAAAFRRALEVDGYANDTTARKLLDDANGAADRQRQADAAREERRKQEKVKSEEVIRGVRSFFGR